MSNTEKAVAVTETVAIIEKAPSKMSYAEEIFKATRTSETPRKAFISQVQLPISQGGAGMGKAYAGTTYQMLQNEAKGGSRYTHHKSAKKKATVADVTVSAETQAAE